MMRPIVQHVAALTEREQVLEPIVGRIAVQVRRCEHDARHLKPSCLHKVGPAGGPSSAIPPYAGGQYSQLVGIGVGKRRWYATIFSFDRPRSRSVSTERHGRSLSRAGFTLHSSGRPGPLSSQSLIFTHASSVFIPTVPPNIARLCSAVYDNTHRLCGVTTSKV
jgi:hypothetical protein